MKNHDLIVIGAGASGYACAINAKKLYPGVSVAVLERLPRSGKKILATGNGRCNLCNLNAKPSDYRGEKLVSAVFAEYGVKDVISFFDSLGLRTFADSEGRVYPKSNTASSVLDALRFAAEDLGVEIICGSKAASLKKSGDRYIINGEYSAPSVVLAAGGKASSAQGSDGSGLKLAEGLGISVTPLYPALVPLTVSSSELKSLKGVRAHDVSLTLMRGDSPVMTTVGEILFTDGGISGIAAMELAGSANEILGKSVKEKCFTRIDFLPGFSENELKEYLANALKIKKNRKIDDYLTGLLPKMLGIEICKVSKLYSGDKSVSSLTHSDIDILCKKIKNFPVEITGTKAFDAAQVTRGGIKTDEINPGTLELKKYPGLFVCGEIIDVDGPCGGYNLLWAWSSGLLAGRIGGRYDKNK